jgi:predicted enzyme related to lactoylglutathione lyase
MLLGLRTVIYPVDDLEAAKQAMSAALGHEPYFDQPFYVGFQVAGYELALDPDGDIAAGPTVYWGVADLDDAVAEYTSRGAQLSTPQQDVGDGIRTAVLTIPAVGRLGLIQNPHYTPAEPTSAGPGR